MIEGFDGKSKSCYKSNTMQAISTTLEEKLWNLQQYTMRKTESQIVRNPAPLGALFWRQIRKPWKSSKHLFFQTDGI